MLFVYLLVLIVFHENLIRQVDALFSPQWSQSAVHGLAHVQVVRQQFLKRCMVVLQMK